MEGKKEIRYRRLASGNEPLVLMADDGNQQDLNKKKITIQHPGKLKLQEKQLPDPVIIGRNPVKLGKTQENWIKPRKAR